MTIKLQVDTAVEVFVNVVPLVSSADFITIDETIAYNEAGMDLNWNFITTAGVVTQTNVVPTTGGSYDWAHVGNGIYKIEIPASLGASINNDTEGVGWFSGICTGVLAWVSPQYEFVPANVVNALVNGSDYLQVDAIQVEGGDATDAITTAATASLNTYDPPTNAEMEARTLLAASYFDPAVDVVARVTLVDTTTVNADMVAAAPTAAANADAVWDETLADHLGVGSTGNALNAAGAAGDPWSTALPGAYGAGTAGKIVGDNIDATISSRSTVTTAQVNAECDTALNDYDAPTRAELTTDTNSILTKLLKYVQLILRSDAAIETDNATELTAINANGGSGAGDYSAQTDSEEALRDWLGNGTNLTEAGGDGDHLTAINLPNQTIDITGNITGNLSGSVGSVSGNVGGNVVGSVGSVVGGLNTGAGVITTLDGLDTAQDAQHGTTQAAIAGLNDPTSAAIADAVWDEAKVGHVGVGSFGEEVQAHSLSSEIAALNDFDPTVDLVAHVTLVDTTTTVTNGVTLANDAITAAKIAADAITDSEISAAAANKIADHILRRSFANAWGSANGDAQTFRSLVGAVAKLVNRVRIAAGVLTIYEDDDLTPVGTQTVTTDAAADPVVELDT